VLRAWQVSEWRRARSWTRVSQEREEDAARRRRDPVGRLLGGRANGSRAHPAPPTPLQLSSDYQSYGHDSTSCAPRLVRVGDECVGPRRHALEGASQGATRPAPQAPVRAGVPRSARRSCRARSATRAAVSATSSAPSSMIRWAPSAAGQLAQRVELLLLCAIELPARLLDIQKIRAPSLSRWAERHARRARRCAEGRALTSASSRSPTACGAALGHAVVARARVLEHECPLASTPRAHLSQRQLAQRGEVLDPEEVVEPPCPQRSSGYTLPSRSRCDQRLGREVR